MDLSLAKPDTSTYNLFEIKRELDLFIRQLDMMPDDEIGIEGHSLLLKPFTGTINVLSRVFHNITTIFSKISGVKRSEIKAYYDNEPLNVKRVFKQSYMDCVGVKILVPAGMVSPYPTVVNHLQQFYGIADLKFIQSPTSTLAAIYKEMSKKNSSPSSLDAFMPSYNKRVLDLGEVFKQHDKDFKPDKKEKDETFGTHFKTMREYRETFDALLEMETVIRGTDKVNKAVDAASKETDKIVSFVEKAIDKDINPISKGFVKDLAKFVRLVAEIYDMYGIVLQSHIAVEHRMVGTTKALYKAT